MPEMKKFWTIAVPSLVACSLAMANIVLAEQRYVVDTIVVSLREGPGSQYKAIKTVQTGQSMEVIESKNNFLRVRTSEGDEGWLPSQYTASQPTSANVLQELQEKVNLLTTQNEQLKAQISDNVSASTSGVNESSGLKKLQQKLDSMTEQYSLLEADSKDILQIRDENKRLKSELTATQTNMEILQRDNKFTAMRQSIYWFLAGGGVFLAGWIVGKFSSRRQRHTLTL